MSERRITRNRLVLIVGGRYKGYGGYTIERDNHGNWLLNIKTVGGNFEDWVSLKHIKPPA